MLERLKEVLFELKNQRIIRNQQEFVELIGYNKSSVSQILNGKTPLSKQFVLKVCEVFPMLNKDYLLDGSGKMFTEDSNMPQKVNELREHKYQSHIPVRVVTTKARAGYVGAYYADEYLNDMPTVLIEADKEYKGNYLAFEVDGDSMEPEYMKGDIVICREVKRDLWQHKLHISEWDFVIAHGTKGIMLKEIISHDVETGEIVCHSLNQEGGENSDFKLNLREVAYLYNVVEHRRSGKRKRMSR